MLEIIRSILYGLIEGVTEWLPVSSTGHLILFEDLFWKNSDKNFMEMFEVVIQLGAILAVVILFFNKLWPFSNKGGMTKSQKWQMWFKVVIACVPAAVIGLLFDDKISEAFYNFTTVAVTLIIYGILFVVIEIWNDKNKISPKINSIPQLSYKMALLIGAFQLLALIPGTSRSGVTIIGAMILGCSRAVSAEFSFFLAVPVMFGASLLKCVKYGAKVSAGEAEMFGGLEVAVMVVGTLVAFAVSLIAIKFLMDFVKRHNFKVFGYYRIVLGIILLLYSLLAR